MENAIALAVQDMHSSCSEPSVRTTSRVRPVINAVLIASVQGTTVPSTGFAPAFGLTVGYGLPQTDDTKALSSGPIAWSPPV